MRKKSNLVVMSIFLTILLCLFNLNSQPTFNPTTNADSVRLVADTKNIEGLPKHFRKTTDSLKVDDGKPLNLKGLSNLNASGSSQFSPNNIKLLKESIGTNLPIVVVDLRQESHGFINDTPVSWLGPKNKANLGLSKEQVLKDEKAKLQAIQLGKPVTIGDKSIIPTKVQDESELVKSVGMSYMRIPVTDTMRPTDEMVDYFIEFVNSLPDNTWLHFHCKEGIGRTTTFMTMYDIMRNAKQVSLEDIMNRQVLLGGKNLLYAEKNLTGNSAQRSEFIRNFYNYSVQNNDTFKTTWSKWLRAQ